MQHSPNSSFSRVVRRVITDKDFIRGICLSKKTPELICDIFFTPVCGKNDRYLTHQPISP